MDRRRLGDFELLAATSLTLKRIRQRQTGPWPPRSRACVKHVVPLVCGAAVVHS